MNYLDILKKYDNAIVTESKKLQDIYDKICEGTTEDGETEKKQETSEEPSSETSSSDEVTPQGESKEDEKQMCQYSEDGDKEVKSDTGEKKMLKAQDFFDGVENTTKPQDQDAETEEKPVETPEEGNGDTPENPESTGDTQKAQDNSEETKNESSVDQRASLSASSLFEDEKEDETSKSDDESKPKENPPAEDTPPAEDKPVETTPEQGSDSKTADESCKGKKCGTMKDWLSEDEDEEKSKDKDDSEEAEETCPDCGNPRSGCTCKSAPEDDEEDEDLERESLQESIRNISAFVEANKKLFGG